MMNDSDSDILDRSKARAAETWELHRSTYIRSDAEVTALAGLRILTQKDEMLRVYFYLWECGFLREGSFVEVLRRLSNEAHHKDASEWAK